LVAWVKQSTCPKCGRLMTGGLLSGGFCSSCNVQRPRRQQIQGAPWAGDEPRTNWQERLNKQTEPLEGIASLILGVVSVVAN